MIIIPDVHGRSFWKEAIKGHEEDRIIFLGDYTDPYIREGIDCTQGLQSIREVIDFKKQHPENVVLLLGNHDLSYISDYIPHCRHDEANHDVIASLINENLSLFNIVHEERVGDRRILFSHAGILPEWLKNNEIIFGRINLGDEASTINRMFHEEDIYAALADVSWYRGGESYAGSCVWADVREFVNLLPDDLPGSYQVFGHTQLAEPMINEWFACLDCHCAFILTDNFEFIRIENN